jgi:hypothetical protein
MDPLPDDGSCDEIHEPSAARLTSDSLLPRPAKKIKPEQTIPWMHLGKNIDSVFAVPPAPFADNATASERALLRFMVKGNAIRMFVQVDLNSHFFSKNVYNGSLNSHP